MWEATAGTVGIHKFHRLGLGIGIPKGN